MHADYGSRGARVPYALTRTDCGNPAPKKTSQVLPSFRLECDATEQLQQQSNISNNSSSNNRINNSNGYSSTTSTSISYNSSCSSSNSSSKQQQQRQQQQYQQQQQQPQPRRYTSLVFPSPAHSPVLPQLQDVRVVIRPLRDGPLRG